MIDKMVKKIFFFSYLLAEKLISIVFFLCTAWRNDAKYILINTKLQPIMIISRWMIIYWDTVNKYKFSNYLSVRSNGRFITYLYASGVVNNN